MTPPSPESARIWMDVTTSLRSRGDHPTGTLRVERTLAAGLSRELGAQLALCRYSASQGRFAPVDLDALAETPARKPTSHGAERQDHLGRRIERFFRLTLRGWLKSRRPASSDMFPEAKPGDALLLGGETWSARYDLDVLHRLRHKVGVKIAAICQDIIPLTHPHFFESGEFVARYRAYVDFLLRDVDLLIVHSRAVRESLQAEAKRVGRPMPEVAIVPLGSDIAKNTAPRAPSLQPPLAPGTFVIAVSTIQSRKNFDLLYRLWHRFADESHDVPRLVIVGARGFGSSDLLKQIENDALVHDSVTVLHGADDAELAWLYRNCRFTLYPSFAEGWGLPVSESLGYGKPCLASNATSLPEAGAGLAVHLDPLDFESWHDTILAWSADDRVIDAMARNIAAHYQPTSWSQTSAALAGHLRNLIA